MTYPEVEQREWEAKLLSGAEVLYDNNISRQPWPWNYYIGHSKIQRIILYILHERNLLDADVWRGAKSLKAVRCLLFKNRRLTASLRASFSRSIRRLEKEGLINRESFTEGYATHIGLTQRGYYQAEFELSWYKQHFGELLTFYGLKTRYGRKKVNNSRNNTRVKVTE